MIKETGVSCPLCVAHIGPDLRLHGHSYEVTAWFPKREALSAQSDLASVLRELDHGLLPPHLSLAEDLAWWVLSAFPDCTEVEVRRPIEGIHARVRR